MLASGNQWFNVIGLLELRFMVNVLMTDRFLHVVTKLSAI